MAERLTHATITSNNTSGLSLFGDGADAGVLIPSGTTAQRNSSANTGEIRFNSTLSDFEYYTGSAWQGLSPDSVETLTNKTIDANGTGNTISNIEVADFASGVLDTDLSSVSSSDDTFFSAKSLVDYISSNLVTTSGTQTLTNKTIDADNNTVSNLEIDNIKASALVLESEGMASSDNDTSIPTTAALIDYYGGGNGISFSSGAWSLNFTGTTDGTSIEVDLENDLLLLYDNDASANKKIKANQLSTPATLNTIRVFFVANGGD